MSHAALAAHLLWLFTHNMHDRHLLLSWYRATLPPLPHGWYSLYIRTRIVDQPHAMRACLNLLARHASVPALNRYCP